MNNKGENNKMGTCPRCLFDSDFETFLRKDKNSIFGELCDRYHGDALTTTREAWINRNIAKYFDSLERSGWIYCV